MPWKETCPTDQRLDFVVAHRSGTISMAALCRMFGISRQTGYKWLNRFSPGQGASSLEDLPCRPDRSPNATVGIVVDRIIARRKQHPNWGARKLLLLLRKQWPYIRWPAPSTVESILKRHGLVRARKRRPGIAPRTQPFSHCAEPNDV